LKVPLIYAASSFYEVLLIILVVVLIFNGLLRRQVLKKFNDKLSHENGNAVSKKNVKTVCQKDNDDEYVDYEIIND
jgi:hypothetical protein